MERPLYDILRGNWSVNRVIDDRHAVQTATFTGSASFTATGTDLAYLETGELALGSATMKAERRYTWTCHANRACVTHADGSPFHTFTLSDGRAKAEHLCGEDLYLGAYRFEAQDAWRVTWTVSGPRKDYTATTMYRRTQSLLQ